MNTETPSINQISPETVESDVYYITTGVKKLNAFFGDSAHARRFLTRDGWLDQEGEQALRRSWNAYSLCFVLMKTSFENIPKQQSVVDLINEKLKDTGCSVTLRRQGDMQMFGLMAKNFFWFGGMSKIAK